MKTPTFTMLIDDIDIETFGLKLISYETQSYVGRKNIGMDIPGAHGTQPVPSALSSSGFVASVVCSGKNAEQVQNFLRRFFAYMYSTQDSHKILFTNDIKVVRYAILNSPEKYKIVEGIDGAMAEIKLTFEMLNPFTYQNDVDSLIVSMEHGQEVILNNQAFECPAIFKLKNTGETTVSNVRLFVNNEVADFTCLLETGDEIVLDTVEYEVRFNGKHRLDYWSGEMPLLKNGDNIISHQNLENLPLLLTVEFTKQWI